MSRYKITAPNADYSGTVGELQFAKGVYVGEVPEAVLRYFRTSGYGIEDAAHAELPGDSGDEQSYAALKVPELKAEIDARNKDRDDEQKLAKSGTKDELIAVLEDDDKAQADALADAGDSGDEQNGAPQ